MPEKIQSSAVIYSASAHLLGVNNHSSERRLQITARMQPAPPTVDGAHQLEYNRGMAAGRLALVTGSSSGIGLGIAKVYL